VLDEHREMEHKTCWCIRISGYQEVDIRESGYQVSFVAYVVIPDVLIPWSPSP
jgi:hypothetical protein